jgi:tryptophan synthase alpha chain
MIDIQSAFLKGTAFIPFLTAGDPNLETTERLIIAMEQAGADLIEIGIPFSDPVAEGEAIQGADMRALAAGTTTDKIFEMVSHVRVRVNIPLLFMTYINPVFTYGTERFIKKCTECGISGLIIPDLPFEEKEEVLPYCEEYGVTLISMIAPTSHERIAKIATESKGFVYCVSSLGVTGVRSKFHANVLPFLEQVRANTDVPIAVGFGISSPEQVREFAQYADGVIVGSAIVKQIEENLTLLLTPEKREEGLANIKTFVQNLTGALK